MKPKQTRRFDTAWASLALGCIVLQFWWLPGESRTTADSYSNSFDGKLALYRMLQEMHQNPRTAAWFPEVERRSDSLIPEGDHDTLLLISPDRYPTPAEEELLYQFVNNGGTLLFAPNILSPNVQLLSLGIDIDEIEYWEAQARSGTHAASPTSPAGPVTGEATDASVSPETDADSTDTNGSVTSPSSGGARTTDRTSPPQDGDPVPPVPVSNPLPGSDETIVSPNEDFDDPLRGTVVETASGTLTDSPIDWRTTGKITQRKFTGVEVLLKTASGSDEVVAWKQGYGTVIVCSSPDVFSNASMFSRPLRRAAVGLIVHAHRQSFDSFETHSSQEHSAYRESVTSGEQASPKIVVSEFLNVSVDYQQHGVLVSPALRSGTLQLVLVAVLCGWFGFHRFGPAIPDDSKQRRTLNESAMAVGNLLYHLRSGGAVIQRYIDYISVSTRRRTGAGLQPERAAQLAAITGLSADEIRENLSRAQTLSKSQTTSTAQVAERLRWLADFHNRLQGNRDRTG
ncbi:MAG: DUF4350 domain-containing protein [Planctomycetaceae bacterium]|nr:DUF4350 domain-containing protein [Planctomycetaceae bacterium]